MTDVFGSLEQLYRNLETALPRADGNPCGSCYECCTGAGLSKHRVSELELGYLREHLGGEKVEEFRRYAERERTEAGELQFPVCPYYDTAKARCTAYQYRPF